MAGTVELIKKAQKTIVFLGTLDEEKRILPCATGFLVSIDGVFHLVTAKHVVQDLKTGKSIDASMYAFNNGKEIDKVSARRLCELKDHFGTDWIFHSQADIDIAIMPFPIRPQEDDCLVIPDELFLEQDNLFELYDIFCLSFQPGTTLTKIAPILRSGTISRMNGDGTFYIDAAAFPGNSGSPVFLKPSPIRFDQKGISIGQDKLGGKFIGVIGSYIPYNDAAYSAQTGELRVVFQENTGLSLVWSVDCIRDIIKSEQFLKQLSEVKALKLKKA